LDALSLERIRFNGDINDIWLGKKIDSNELSRQDDGTYLSHDDQFAAVRVIETNTV